MIRNTFENLYWIKDNNLSEKKRHDKIIKAEMLIWSWELAQLCKEFLKKYEGEWDEGKERALARRDNLEKEKRLEIVIEKKSEIEKKKMQTKIIFQERNLSVKGRDLWKNVEKTEKRKERLELAEMKENLWKWRGGGREKTKKSLERKKEIAQEELENKLEKLTKILEKERN